MPVTHMPLRLSTVKIEASAGYRFDAVQIAVEDGTATVKNRDGTLNGTKDGVVTVANDPNSRGWIVSFATGETWTVQRDTGCGCGGSR